MQNVQIRQAVLSDLQHLVPVLDSYRVFCGHDSDVEAARRFLRERFNHGESVLFMASAASAAVGFCQLYPSFSSLSLARTFIVNDLYVVKSHRHQGIASMLLKGAADYAKQLKTIGLTNSTGVAHRAVQCRYGKGGWIRDEGFCVYNLKILN